MVGWKGFGVAARQRNSCSKFGWFTYWICVRVRTNEDSGLIHILTFLHSARRDHSPRLSAVNYFKRSARRKPCNPSRSSI